MNINQQRRKLLTLAGYTALGATLPYGLMSSISQANTKQTVHQWPPFDNSIVIDGLSALFDYGVESFSKETLALFKQSGITALNTTVPYPGDDHKTTMEKITQVKKVIKQYPEYFSLIRTASDIILAKQTQTVGIIIGFQSSEMFGNDLSQIGYFADQGCRYMQLTYNKRSQFGDGGLEKDNLGLTPLGIEAVREIQNNNVLLDLSHSGQKTVSDAIKIATKPLTISHTGCNSIYRHPRNNDDAELKAIADKGGVIGLYLMPFLEGGDGEVTAESLMRHIDYAINLCGEDHVSIGSDQGVLPVDDGPEYREMIRKDVERRVAAGISAPGESANRPPFIPQLNTIRRMELIAYQMKKRGHSNRVIEKVLGTNLLKLYQQIW